MLREVDGVLKKKREGGDTSTATTSALSKGASGASGTAGAVQSNASATKSAAAAVSTAPGAITSKAPQTPGKVEPKKEVCYDLCAVAYDPCFRFVCVNHVYVYAVVCV